MIHGYKANGGFVSDKIERETRQCVHCQFIWTYVPGSGVLRGYCLKHNGFLCARSECFQDQERMLDEYERIEKKRLSCIAFEEFNEWRGLRLLHAGNDWTLNSEGILVPKYGSSR